MKLPRSEVGISDLLQHRDCPTRFEYSMRRHDQGDPPESWSPANAYGSAIHLAMHELGEGKTEDEAVQAAFNEFAQFLDPEDLALLHEDIETYMQRDTLGVRTLISEDDLRVPLFIYEGEQIYFRFKLDRLYVRVNDPTSFIHKDFKSSKHIKSEDEVHSDIQQWAYNWGIHEAFPECETLEQEYDQLRGGVVPTSKNDLQRSQIKEWLIRAATRVLEDEALAPTFNEWCPWCPLLADCKVVREDLTKWAQTRIAVLAPRQPKLKKDGTPGRALLPPELDPDRFEEYVEVLDDVSTAQKTLKAYHDEVYKALKAMDAEARAEHGYRKGRKSSTTFTATALQEIHERLGPRFYHLVTLTMAAAGRMFDEGSPELTFIEEQVERGIGPDFLTRITE